MRLIFIRHGDPDYENDTLTEKGWREAKLLAERVKKWDVTDFYVSPLGRAQDTASLSLKAMGRTAETLDWLREFDGSVPANDIHPKNIPWDLYPAVWTENEDFYDRNKWYKTDFMQRGNVEEKLLNVQKGIDDLLAKYGYIHENGRYTIKEHSDATIVLFCHFGVSALIISHILGISPINMWHGFNLAPTSVTVLGCEEREKTDGFFRCHVWGCTKHLAAGNEPISPSGYFTEVFQG